MIYRCKNCGGNAVYSPEKGTMFCPSCEGTDCEEPFLPPESGNLLLCPNCGGELPLEKFTSALKCPFCDNYLILDERLEGAYQPKMIAPFRVGMEEVKSKIKERFGKMKFVPKDLVSDAKLDGMQGWYVPFWFYDYDTELIFDGTCTHVKTWKDDKFEYVERSDYDVHRNLGVKFRKLPVDASDAMPDSTMDLLAPFNYDDTKPYDSRLLSGFYAEQYNQSSAALEERAKKLMESNANTILNESVSKGPEVNYQEHNPVNRRTDVKSKDVSFGLMPVWKYDYIYHDQHYPFYINGQTGKIVGDTPVDKTKVWLCSALAGIILAVILYLLMKSIPAAIIGFFIAGGIFAGTNLRQRMSGNTTTVMTYVADNQVKVNLSTDRFITKRLDKKPLPPKQS